MLVSFNPNVFYKLTNAFHGDETALDIVNDAGTNSSGKLKMASYLERGHTGQHWQFRPHEDGYKLVTEFLGTSKTLDVYGDDKTQLHLSNEGNFSGQKWFIKPHMRNGTWDGTYKLWNYYSGDQMFLDTYSGSHRLFMGTGDHSGKHWTITPIRPITSEHFLLD